jgi:hypothetical protein
LDPVAIAPLDDWTPVWIRTAGEPVVDWAMLGGPLSDPFFEQTADRAMRRPFNQVFARATSLAALPRAHAHRAPDGFVFHMSRCGSTLVAQMLAALPASVVISEAQPVDALLALRRAGRLDDAAAEDALRGLLAALVRPQREHARRLFVKFHASHVLELPFLARAFPGVPWVFLFREPRAVLRSQERALGAETFAAMTDGVPGTEGAARAVAGYCEAALRHAETGRSLFVDYAALPDALRGEILPFFGVALEAGEDEHLRAASRRDTKRPGDFVPHDRPDGDPHVDELAARWLDAPYAALRALAAAPR